jgi:SET domain-containing protein
MPRRPFRIGRSITGFGLFATRPIKKKARITEYKGPILDYETAQRAENRGNRYLFEVSKHRTIDGTPRYNVARYANHSCNPNAEPIVWRGRVFIKSLRNIKPGEEIVYDYGLDYLRNVIGRSNCRCSRCRRRRARKAREARAAKKRIKKRGAKRRARR